MTNFYGAYMSDDYGRLQELLDEGYVVVCYVDYVFDTGGEKRIFRDVAKAKKRSERYNIGSPNYGYVVEARGIRYIDWDNRQGELRHNTFIDECRKLKLEFIDLC